MRLSRALFPLLLALILLLAQQAGIMHALSHTLAQQVQDQQDKQPSHYPACEQCAAYSELGSALTGTICLLLVMSVAAAAPRSGIITFRAIQPLAVVARGPPPAFLPMSA